MRYSRQWTVEQTSSSRMVTKVRWVIEAVNGKFQKMQGLVNVRNTMLPHIMIDYRISAAMFNFVHKPLCADGKNARVIANRIKKKALKIRQKNNLDVLIRLSLGKKYLPEYNIAQINDFPRLKKKHIERKINMGTFFTKQAKMYLQDLLNNQIIYILKKNFTINNQNDAKELLNSFKNTKIIGAEFVSRHGRGSKPTTYKTFVQYIPVNRDNKACYDDTKLIKGSYIIIKKSYRINNYVYLNK